MVIKIDAFNSNIPSSSIEDYIRSNCFRYINYLRLENCNEYKIWNSYITKKFNIDLYKALYKLISDITVNKTGDDYIININRNQITDKLNAEQLASLIRYGNLDIRKSYLIDSMINYAIRDM